MDISAMFDPTPPRRITVLGATGSVGASTLDVIARHPERLSVYALSAHHNMVRLAEQAHAARAVVVVVPDEAARARFRAAWPTGTSGRMPEIRLGAQALADTAADPDCDTVVAAIVGTAGLPAALAAARAGKRILLANKEALVAAGPLFMQAVAQSGTQLLPIDSEHNAIFQCLPQGRHDTVQTRGVERLILTASGGPFRNRHWQTLHDVTPAEACAHPNWSMGQKISVDSATLFNKGLELIEAHWLFAMPAARIDVLVHPQSVIHSLVEYDDGSVLAQLAQPDMRIPIAHGLGFPERIASGASRLDLSQLGRLDFEPLALDQAPCLQLALTALSTGQAACIALNAANEIAVAAFLAGHIKYTDIATVIAQTLDWQAGQMLGVLDSLDAILAADEQARARARSMLVRLSRRRAAILTNISTRPSHGDVP